LDGVLVAEPVRALDGVVEVEAPVVLAHVAERGRDAALRRDGVRAGREHLGNAGGVQALGGEAEGGAQSGAAGADDHDVVLVLGDGIGGVHVGSLYAWRPALRGRTRCGRWRPRTAARPPGRPGD